MLKSFFTILLSLLLSVSYGQSQSNKDSVRLEQVPGDGDFTYSKKLLINSEFDFKLHKTQSGKFIISFYKNENKPVVIKIYDITGNLIKQETVVEHGPFSKEYNLSYYKPSFFVVEVGSAKYNKTKSIMAE
ncbi:MAG: hypothetical protein ACJAT1_000702 [Marivirga sp.]|jgi:hypothetical protein